MRTRMYVTDISRWREAGWYTRMCSGHSAGGDYGCRWRLWLPVATMVAGGDYGCRWRLWLPVASALISPDLYVEIDGDAHTD
ncbi:hypothetical protein MDOR_15420 [Mycolicibacterium doricum]|uniref:Uncharacterized protein n=1 Tax=Mycolicibacterium doricum TaxID=126673 RepID=A0A7I7VT73_9MYCO|nr:hypothetical protein MDOR_15420 [Mycolicibacterium doricum]